MPPVDGVALNCKCSQIRAASRQRVGTMYVDHFYLAVPRVFGEAPKKKLAEIACLQDDKEDTPVRAFVETEL